MKIVEVINSLSYRGGAQVFFSQLCEEISKQKGVKLFVVVLYDKIDSSFDDFQHNKNLTFIYCHKKRRFDLKAARLFKQIILDIKPDIINYHLNFLLLYYLAFGYKKNTWKLIKTFHSIPGRDTDFVNRLLESVYAKKQLINFIGISDSITSIASRKYKNAVIKTIFNGIKIKSIKNNEIEKKYDYIIVASLEPVKNHILLFNAFLKLLETKTNATLLVVGNGSLFNELKSFVLRHRLEQNIIMIGSVENVGVYLQQSYYFVLSSLREGNPISILEALNYGLPIIAPSIGGIPDIIKNEKNGLLFNAGDPDDLILKLIMAYQLDYQTISKTNYELSLRFGIEQCCMQYLSFFEEIIKK